MGSTGCSGKRATGSPSSCRTPAPPTDTGAARWRTITWTPTGGDAQRDNRGGPEPGRLPPERQAPVSPRWCQRRSIGRVIVGADVTHGRMDGCNADRVLAGVLPSRAGPCVIPDCGVPRSPRHTAKIGAASWSYDGSWHRAPVAQLDRALASGARGRRFESCRAYHRFGSAQSCTGRLNRPETVIRRFRSARFYANDTLPSDGKRSADSRGFPSRNVRPCTGRCLSRPCPPASQPGPLAVRAYASSSGKRHTGGNQFVIPVRVLIGRARPPNRWLEGRDAPLRRSHRALELVPQGELHDSG